MTVPADPREAGYPYGEMDAAKWTDEFFTTYPDGCRDHDTMLGWFANAIMTGYDEAQHRAARQDEPSPALRSLDALKRTIEQRDHDYALHLEQVSDSANWTEAEMDAYSATVGGVLAVIDEYRAALAANPPQTREAEGAAGYDGGDDDAAMVATAEKPVLRVATPSGDEAVRPGDGANDRGDRGVRGGGAADAADAADSSRLAQALPGFVPGNWLRRNVVLSAYRRAPEAAVMTPLVTFGVVGTPIPQGSMKAFIRGGKPRVVAGNAGALERWRGDIRSGCIRELLAGLVDGPVGMRLDFRLARPKSHYHPANSRRLAQELRADAPDRVAGGPDLDKLARAVLDALTGIVYVDDRQVAELGATKRYAAAGLPPGVDVRVVAL